MICDGKARHGLAQQRRSNAQHGSATATQRMVARSAAPQRRKLTGAIL